MSPDSSELIPFGNQTPNYLQMNQLTQQKKGGILNAKFHIYAVIGCLIYTTALGLITRGKLEGTTFLLSFLLMISQVELFAWIGTFVFKKIIYNSVKEFIQKTIKRLLIFYLFVIVIAGLMFVAVSAAWSYHQGIDLALFFKQLPERELRGFIIGSSFGLLTGTVIFFFMELIAVIKREQQLNEEKMRYHYETLKNQLNPHFLFNSLNTLSSIIYQDVHLADRFIVKLSSIYRYILDQQESKLVSLENELSFVRDYFYLQQIRDENRISLDINIDHPSNYMILPVSLQLLVENALKHNIATDEKPLKIKISMINNHYLMVENNRQPKQQLEGSFQIGLKNLTERVRMITGNELSIEQSNDRFSVKIPIDSK
jgi:two-component system, LytTR family, sensor kinase